MECKVARGCKGLMKSMMHGGRKEGKEGRREGER